MLVVAVGWQVYALTGRVLDLGLIGLSQFLPFLCLSLFAGHAADRYDRRRIVASCFAAFLLSALALLLLSLRQVTTTGPIFAVLGLLGVARAFLAPAMQSLVPNLVPVEFLGNAYALSSSSFQIATIVGPSFGGIFYAYGEGLSGAAGAQGGAVGGYGTGAGHGAAAVYGAAVVLLAGALWMLGQVHITRRQVEHRAVSMQDLLAGLRFVLRHKVVMGAMSLDLFAVLFGGAAALLPAFTRDALHQGPATFGYLRAAPGVGAALCALWLTFRPINRHIGPAMFAGVAVFGAATIVFGLTRNAGVAFAALVVLGIGDMVSVFVRMLLVQLQTPDSIRGRVSAVNSVCIGASNELGEFESGFTAAWFGLVPAIVLGGGLTLLVAALWAGVLFPRLWRLDTFDQLKDQPPNAT